MANNHDTKTPLETIKLNMGDGLEGLKQAPDKSIDAIITDPPYNIGIDTWDRIPDYINWLMEFFKEFDRTLKDTGTLWFFHMDFKVLAELDQRIKKETRLRHKQQIIIDKGLRSIAGRAGKSLRSYPRATEYLQFYTFNDPTGAEQLSDEYARVNPMAKYLRDELARSGVEKREITNLFLSKQGNTTGCLSNWIMGKNFPCKDQYETIRDYLNQGAGSEYLRKDYEYLRKDYEELREEYEALRYTFNLESGVTDVWQIDFYKEKIKGHKSPKPTGLMRRIIRTATNRGGLVCDPFMGVGSTAVACKQTGRDFIGYEKKKPYYDIARKQVKGAVEIPGGVKTTQQNTLN